MIGTKSLQTLAPAPLRVGIVGHRPGRQGLADPSEEIVRVFGIIDHAWRSEAGNTPVVLVSGLAEGVDQIGVQLRPADWTVDAVLPFPRDDYLQDFRPSFSGSGNDVTAGYLSSLKIAAATGRIVEFADTPPEPERAPGDGATMTRDPLAYKRAAGFLLRSVNFLIAVWDGKPPRGPGGTADTIYEAARIGVPVVWIDARGAKETELVYGLSPAGTPRCAECTNDALRRLAAPQASGNDSPTTTPSAEQEKLREFLDEAVPSSRGWRLFYWLRALATWTKPPRGSQPPEWDSFLSAAPGSCGIDDDLRSAALSAYVKADSLGIYYANMYRSLYIGCYMLSFFAILTALAGFLLPGHLSHAAALDFKAALVFLELVLISAIIGLVLWSRRRRWREKWLDYRELAEQLRHLRFLAFVGQHRMTAGILRNFPLSPDHSQARWTLVYTEYLARRIGIPNAVIDERYLSALASAIKQFEIRGQIDYHRKTEHDLKSIGDLLHKAEEICFWSTFAILIAFLLGYIFIPGEAHATSDPAGAAHGSLRDRLYEAKALIGFFAAALPALGAAFAGIRFTGEFANFSERSAAMAAALGERHAECEAIRRTPHYDALGEFAVRLSTLLSVDVAVWRSVFRLERQTV